MLDTQKEILHWGAQLVLVKKLVLSANVTTKFQRKSPARSQGRGGMLIRQGKLWIEGLNPIVVHKELWL